MPYPSRRADADKINFSDRRTDGSRFRSRHSRSPIVGVAGGIFGDKLLRHWKACASLVAFRPKLDEFLTVPKTNGCSVLADWRHATSASHRRGVSAIRAPTQWCADHRVSTKAMVTRYQISSWKKRRRSVSWATTADIGIKTSKESY